MGCNCIVWLIGLGRRDSQALLLNDRSCICSQILFHFSSSTEFEQKAFLKFYCWTLLFFSWGRNQKLKFILKQKCYVFHKDASWNLFPLLFPPMKLQSMIYPLFKSGSCSFTLLADWLILWSIIFLFFSNFFVTLFPTTLSSLKEEKRVQGINFFLWLLLMI